MTELNVVSRSRDSGLLWVRSRSNILGVPKPQHLLPCPLQLLEMSFNCLEDVESTIPVSPLHLAVSPSFFLLPSLSLPAPGPHASTRTCDSVLGFCLLAGT